MVEDNYEQQSGEIYNPDRKRGTARLVALFNSNKAY